MKVIVLMPDDAAEQRAYRESHAAWNTHRPRGVPAIAPAPQSILTPTGWTSTTPKRSTDVGR